MVLLEEQKLLFQGLQLALEVHAIDVSVVDDFLQACNIRLHRLPDGQLVLVPAAQQNSSGWRVLNITYLDTCL